MSRRPGVTQASVARTLRALREADPAAKWEIVFEPGRVVIRPAEDGRRKPRDAMLDPEDVPVL